MGFIAESVERLRKAAKMTQKRLGELSNLSGSRISDIEKCNYEPTAEQVVNIAKALEEPALMLAKCRECGIRTHGFKEFFPDMDISNYAELEHVIDQLQDDLDSIDEQLSIVTNMRTETDEFNEQFGQLRHMMRHFSYTAAVGANIADLTVFLKRGFVKFGNYE